MKHALITVTFALLAALPAQARIGETSEEIDARYGQGQKSADRLKNPETGTWKYSKGGFFIEVIFFNGKSIWEMFNRKDKVITDDDIKDILKVNSAPGTSWQFSGKEHQWRRGGTPKLIAYREHGHDDFFSIRDVVAAEAAEKKDKSAF